MGFALDTIKAMTFKDKNNRSMFGVIRLREALQKNRKTSTLSIVLGC